MFYSTFDFAFGFIFPVIFLLVIIAFIFSIVKAGKQWHKNEHSPVLAVDAQLVGKDKKTHVHQSGEHMEHTHTTTDYYLIFQVESGDRLEFKVNRSEYTQLAEGDSGKLTFQGTRYKGFERKIIRKEEEKDD